MCSISNLLIQITGIVKGPGHCVVFSNLLLHTTGILRGSGHCVVFSNLLINTSGIGRGSGHCLTCCARGIDVADGVVGGDALPHGAGYRGIRGLLHQGVQGEESLRQAA